LGLSTDAIPDSAKGAAAIKQVLSGLAQIVGGAAELRNLYGTGHGRTRVGGADGTTRQACGRNGLVVSRARRQACECGDLGALYQRAT
jgi:hypothetical protein